MPPDAMRMKVRAHFPAHHEADQRADQRRRAAEEVLRSALEVLVDHPPPVDHGPVEVIFEHLLHAPRHATLVCGQAPVEVEPVFLLDVQADQRGVGDDGAVIGDVG
jgi:hypothetical protein